MASADRILSAENASPAPATHTLRRGALLAILGVLLFYVALQGRALWQEWTDLQGELAAARRAAVIGYYNIRLNPSYARKPANWCHDEGDQTLLWSGWTDGRGHNWFHVQRGDIDPTQLSEPMGRDVALAIDRPIIEIGDGTIWRRIPDEADVAGQELSGVTSVYPLLLLDKVAAVNDLIDGQPYLVTYNPCAPRPDCVSVYVPVIGGARVRMGASGYFQDRRPVLYDRDTESLWVDRPEGLYAVAGVRKGTTLRRVARPLPMHWSDWRARHPRSRLIVGADRAHELSEADRHDDARPTPEPTGRG